MPDGPIDETTLAVDGIAAGAEQVWHDFTVDPALLVDGVNTVAVEVHNKRSGSSGDISFDLSMTADVADPAPTITWVPKADAPEPLPQVEVVAEGAQWAFEDSGAAPASGWADVGFDDSSWSEGPAELGFGDSDEATVIGEGNRIAYYFRRSFSVDDTSGLLRLSGRLKRDDGALVYVNGTEVFRSNMPDGPIDETTLAVDGIAAGAEQVWHDFTVDPALLVDGVNTVAVEVHNKRTGSSDISFDLSMTADVADPAPTITDVSP